jgi:hypothetical protein
MRALLCCFLLAMTSTAAVRIEKTAFEGWPNCYRLTNGEVELIVTSDIGPRVMRYGFVGGQNLFWVQPEGRGKSGEPAWVTRGGHRLWVGPEDIRYTYPPDNGPVRVETRDGVLIATQPIEKETGIEKQIEIRLDPQGTGVTLIHRLRYTGTLPVEFAAWAPTMMAPGGIGVHPFPPRGTHPENLQPTNPLVMWAFSDLSDDRWKFTKKYMTLRQVPGRAVPTKLGTFNKTTIGAYLLNGDIFVKRYDADPSKTYPEFGCSFETFTNQDFLELETLGPVTKVAGGETVTHTERWVLGKGTIREISDAELDRVLLPLLQR